MFEKPITHKQSKYKEIYLIVILFIGGIAILVFEIITGCPHIENTYQNIVCQKQKFSVNSEITTNLPLYKFMTVDQFYYYGQDIAVTSSKAYFAFIVMTPGLYTSSMILSGSIKINGYEVDVTITGNHDVDVQAYSTLFDFLWLYGENIDTIFWQNNKQIEIKYQNHTETHIYDNGTFYAFVESQVNRLSQNVTIWPQFVCSACWQDPNIDLSTIWLILVGLLSVFGSLLKIINFIWVKKEVIKYDEHILLNTIDDYNKNLNEI